MSVYERMLQKLSAPTSSIPGMFDRWITPAAAVVGAGSGIYSAMHRGGPQDPPPSFGSAIPQAVTAGSLLGGFAYLMGRRPYGIPVSTGKNMMGDLTTRFFEGGTSAALAAAPAYAAGRILSPRGRQSRSERLG